MAQRKRQESLTRSGNTAIVVVLCLLDEFSFREVPASLPSLALET